MKIDESPLTKQETKDALKSAIKEWLNEQFLAFGKFSFCAIASAGICALLYFILKMNGWSIAQTSISR
jgi:hypothetical protein